METEPKNPSGITYPIKGRKRESAAAKKADTLEQTLWDAAVKLRGNVAPADYKHYVLPLIFLRYCSLRFDDRRDEITKEIKGLRNTYQVSLESFLKDRDEYERKNVFVVPEKASWSYLVKNARRDDIKTVVDDALEAMEKENPKLRGILRRVYAGSNLDAENLRSLISLFSSGMFALDKGQGLDMLGKTYEYFIGNFANTEGARGGEYFTPESVVRVLVECMEPKEGVVFDPACGSGGMFVQSDRFAHHAGALSFYGQERIDTTVRLCQMNLILHGLRGDIHLGNSLMDDKFPDLKADFVIANPPFNLKQWGADRLDRHDARLLVDGKRYGVTEGNANYMWLLHYLHHLKAGGVAGTVMSNGSLTTGVREEYELRKAFVQAGIVDCIIQLPAQLFSQTGIPVCLWILRKRTTNDRDVFFIDARKLGKLKEGSRKQKELSEEEIRNIADAYTCFKQGKAPSVAGFCAPAKVDAVTNHGYKLSPGIYVGSEVDDVIEGDFEAVFKRLTTDLESHFAEAGELQAAIRRSLVLVRSGE